MPDEKIEVIRASRLRAFISVIIAILSCGVFAWLAFYKSPKTEKSPVPSRPSVIQPTVQDMLVAVDDSFESLYRVLTEKESRRNIEPTRYKDLSQYRELVQEEQKTISAIEGICFVAYSNWDTQDLKRLRHLLDDWKVRQLRDLKDDEASAPSRLWKAYEAIDSEIREPTKHSSP